MSRGSISHNYEYIPGFSTALQKINPSRLLLKVRQQPVQTRVSTNNERDRKPLSPPPIVQIELLDSSLQETQDFLQNPYLFICVNLVHSVTHENIVHSAQNTLSGQTTSSMYKLKDINNHDGGFFVFGDLSVKLEGHFRLKFSVFEISQYGAVNLQSTYSDVFQVYPSKTFPGILESTFLSRSFSDQGVRIRIRKEHRVQINGSRKRKMSTQEEAYDITDDKFNSFNHHHQQSLIMQDSSCESFPLRSGSVDYSDQRRRSSMMSYASEDRRLSLQSIFRRASHIPVSPPHQSYDHSNYHPLYHSITDMMDYEKSQAQQQQQVMIPSPPPQLSVSSEHRRLSVELMRKRRPEDEYYHPLSNSSISEQVIHLPPLRTVISNTKVEEEGINAAVAMMELSTRRQQQQQEQDEANRPYYYNY